MSPEAYIKERINFTLIRPYCRAYFVFMLLENVQNDSGTCFGFISLCLENFIEVFLYICSEKCQL